MIIPDTSILTNQVKIRNAIEQDLPSLEWDGEYSHFRNLYHEIYHSSLNGDIIIWLADLEGIGVVGQIFVQLYSTRIEFADGYSRAYLFAFRVRKDYRSLGIGSLLLKKAESDLIEKGFTYSLLNVSRENGYARSFYEKFGYKVIGEEPGIWTYIDQYGQLQEVNDPSWRMEKKLGKVLGEKI